VVSEAAAGAKVILLPRRKGRIDVSQQGLPVEEETSQPFVARWNRLISTTNWEKGRIIYEWRESLIAAGAPASEYSDEAWRRKVEGISGQHVGRLRRVYERFGGVYETYAGLYWSHFQAALDWNDAEMWLEGAVQNRWSVSEMRRQRWEALGAPEDKKPSDDDIISVELDEGATPPREANMSERFSPTLERVEGGPDYDQGPDFGDESGAASEPDGYSEPVDEVPPEAAEIPAAPSEKPQAVRPFEALPQLPPDVDEAYEQFKLVILRHKLAGWTEVSAKDIVTVLNALKVMVTSTTE
jgi:hypothetical protein